jgi:hypothetical protein
MGAQHRDEPIPLAWLPLHPGWAALGIGTYRSNDQVVVIRALKSPAFNPGLRQRQQNDLFRTMEATAVFHKDGLLA